MISLAFGSDRTIEVSEVCVLLWPFVGIRRVIDNEYDNINQCRRRVDLLSRDGGNLLSAFPSRKSAAELVTVLHGLVLSIFF